MKFYLVSLLALGISAPISHAFAANPVPDKVYDIMQESGELNGLRGEAQNQSSDVDCLPFVVRTYDQMSGALTAISQCFDRYPDDGPSLVGEIVVHGHFYGNDQLVIERVK